VVAVEVQVVEEVEHQIQVAVEEMEDQE